MSQRKRQARVFGVEFKLAAVKRLLKGESVSALSKEIGVLRKDLYVWKRAYQRGGESLLWPRGRPDRDRTAQARAAIKSQAELTQARQRIGELERKIGQQELELDFFEKALRCVEQTGKPTSERSANSSKRKPRKAN